MQVTNINVPLDIVIAIAIGVLTIIGTILIYAKSAKEQTIFNSKGFNYPEVGMWITLIIFLVVIYISMFSKNGPLEEAKTNMEKRFEQADVIEEKEATVVDKTKNVKVSSDEAITPVVIKGKMINPIVGEGTTIPYLMRLYDGKDTYTIAVDKKTYNWYDEKDTVPITVINKKAGTKIEIHN